MRFPRSSGILCHITSLPTAIGDREFGIGDLGKASYAFVDFLQAAGQTIWQVLPLGPPAAGNSPYSCYSAFAGNPLLISLSMLVEDGLLDEGDFVLPSGLGETTANVDYHLVGQFKLPALRTAFEKFSEDASEEQRADFDRFVELNAWWLDDFGRFEALMRHFGSADWTKWPAELVRHAAHPEFDQAIEQWEAKLSTEIQFAEFQQYIFDVQWRKLKQYANDRNVRMYGDMPIFVAHESADVWANQSVFCLADDGRPTFVAGVPPDYFSKTGQLWGNPQYRWDALEQTNYRWWVQRFGYAFKQFDLMRIDHFRGFEAYWEIPATAKTAVSGKWVEGPREKVFDAAREKLGELALIAEDLGMITEEVHELRDKLGFPGMRVLQFGFYVAEDDFHRPSAFPEHSVAYTGTHDNDTVMGWYNEREVAEGEQDLLADVVTSDVDIHLQLIWAVLNSASDTAIIPVQDLLGLGNEARMNMPGLADGNWAWRLLPGQLTESVASTIGEMTRNSRR
ncbi:4-alpha-glucanotransferase [Rhodopirellula maiorica SM1]|uniref:4-alpha-glucanotransferase n=1 Tax=Rhodopirellula maiorica SM1 TaxID=1265738 RepID=M5RLC6_9BACT|nr:4-alpha-glucanotransferase [Rhodopirellula maiorica]EMI16182.1 4-alpha-glucanotransferase [Rhodopirellula maiorica SM1]